MRLTLDFREARATLKWDDAYKRAMRHSHGSLRKHDTSRERAQDLIRQEEKMRNQLASWILAVAAKIAFWLDPENVKVTVKKP